MHFNCLYGEAEELLFKAQNNPWIAKAQTEQDETLLPKEVPFWSELNLNQGQPPAVKPSFYGLFGFGNVILLFFSPPFMVCIWVFLDLQWNVLLKTMPVVSLRLQNAETGGIIHRHTLKSQKVSPASPPALLGNNNCPWILGRLQ